MRNQGMHVRYCISRVVTPPTPPNLLCPKHSTLKHSTLYTQYSTGHTANGQPCLSLATNGVYKAALVMQSRITNILKHNSFVGFARDAPSEFLQSYGVLEGKHGITFLHLFLLSSFPYLSRALQTM